jgi:YHS domain-containing protein
MEACPNCQAVRINGVLCHETGCPTPYIGKTLDCVWCGTKFKAPAEEEPIKRRIMGRERYFCSEDCLESFNS